MPVPLFNGADFDFEGSILDASLRMGYVMENDLELFGNSVSSVVRRKGPAMPRIPGGKLLQLHGKLHRSLTSPSEPIGRCDLRCMMPPVVLH
jgi:hypothetical protein